MTHETTPLAQVQYETSVRRHGEHHPLSRRYRQMWEQLRAFDEQTVIPSAPDWWK